MHTKQQKLLNKEDRQKIATLKTPGQAKRAGKNITLRADWDLIKIHIMETLLHLKFADPILKEKLLATNDAELIEDNNWNDQFWGVYKGKGRNELGKALMRVRTFLRLKFKITNAS